MNLKSFLLYILLIIFPSKNGFMSSYYDLSVSNNYINITTTLVIPETDPWDSEEEEVKEWREKTLPLMNKILDTLQHKLPKIYKDLNLNLIKIDSSYTSIWEENVDANDVGQFIASNKEYCQYKMRLYGLDIHNIESNELTIIDYNGRVDHLYLSLVFDKNIPEKIVRDSLKVRILNVLKKMGK